MAAVVVVFLGAGDRGGSSLSPAAGRSLTLIYRVQPRSHAPRLTNAAIDHELALIRERLRGLGARSHAIRIGADEINSRSRGRTRAPPPARLSSSSSPRATRCSSTTGRRTCSCPPAGVDGQLSSHQATALTLSQGTGSDTPVRRTGRRDALPGDQAGVESARGARHGRPVPAWARVLLVRGSRVGSVCSRGSRSRRGRTRRAALLSGRPGVERAPLRFELPRGVSASDGQVLKVPQGIVVVQAANQSTIGLGVQAARFFVLRDRAALSGAQISDPHAVSADGGLSESAVRLYAVGRRTFQSLTATVAHRGQIVSSGVDHLFQHFAVVFDGRLLSVPQIDFAKYPDGVVETPHQTRSGSSRTRFSRPKRSSANCGSGHCRWRCPWSASRGERWADSSQR